MSQSDRVPRHSITIGVAVTKTAPSLCVGISWHNQNPTSLAAIEAILDNDDVVFALNALEEVVGNHASHLGLEVAAQSGASPEKLARISEYKKNARAQRGKG